MSNWKNRKFDNETGIEIKSQTKSTKNLMKQISGKIKETEKAVYFENKLDLMDIHKVVTFGFWCPKSLIKDEKIPLWFLNNKINEFLQSIKCNSSNVQFINI